MFVRYRWLVLGASLSLLAGRIGAQVVPSPSPVPSAAPAPTPAQRVPVEKRRFTSDAVEREIVRVKASVADPELARMFELCYPNTLDTTVTFGSRSGKPDTFIITGDIGAMWLRDSSAQVDAYLPFCKDDPHLAEMIAGLIHRQAACILIDPYANAFQKDASKPSAHSKDRTEMRPGVFERKWEVDSLCYCMKLAYRYWKVTRDNATFDAEWQKAMRLAVATFRDQQRKDGQGSYQFIRGRADGPTGYGSETKPTGMICARFRNSDDNTAYQFNISDNLFAVTSLRQLAEMSDALMPGDPLSAECRSLAREVEQGIKQFGIVDDPKWGKVYAYECDGLGHTLLMDDAGIPGQLSIPYFSPGLDNDPVVLNTRRYALSPDNPWFFRGVAAEGLGSVHTGKDKVWPLGLMMRAITSKDDAEITACLGMLKNSSAGTGFVHESFNKDDPTKFSRKWFAWANNLFGETIIKVLQEKPQLLTKPIPAWQDAAVGAGK